MINLKHTRLDVVSFFILRGGSLLPSFFPPSPRSGRSALRTDDALFFFSHTEKLILNTYKHMPVPSTGLFVYTRIFLQPHSCKSHRYRHTYIHTHTVKRCLGVGKIYILYNNTVNVVLKMCKLMLSSIFISSNIHHVQYFSDYFAC